MKLVSSPALCAGFLFFFFFVGSSVIIFHLSQFLDYVTKKKKSLNTFFHFSFNDEQDV